MQTNSSPTAKKKNFSPSLFIGVLIFAIGFCFATVWDLPLDTLIYSPTNPFAVFMEAFGWYPAFLIFVFYCATWYSKLEKNGKTWQKALTILLSAITLAIMVWDSIRRLTSRNWVTGFTDWKSLVIALIVFAIGFLLFYLVCKTSWQKVQKELSFFGFWGTVYLAGNQVVIFIVKTIWQRTRFDEMLALGNFDDFTPWFRPFGNGGNSFPSGHTANAAGVFVLIILCDLFLSWSKKKNLIYILVWLYISLMAFSRILIGRHFLSDTLAAAGIMALLFFIMRRTPYYKNELEKIKKKNKS